MAPRESTLKLKRIYDEPTPDDGVRVLVDRLWPRGLSKEKAHVDHWLKDIAPSSTLRKWFAHDPAKFSEFHQHYNDELEHSAQAQQAITTLHDLQKAGPITILTATHDIEHSHAQILYNMLLHSHV